MKKLNFVVIATHHGAFVTLQSIFELPASKLGNVLVLIPKHQLDKYATYKDEPIFCDYQSHLINFIGNRKNVNIFIIDEGEWFLKNPLLGIARSLKEKKKKGLYIALQAGSVFNKENIQFHQEDLEDFVASGKTIKIARNRVYDNNKQYDMYKMVGLPEKLNLDQRYNKQTFLISADALKSIPLDHQNDVTLMIGNLMKVANTKLFGKYDDLIDLALPSRTIAYHGIRSNKALASQYWPQAMSPTQKLSQEMIWGCGPLTRYAELSKKVSEYIPPKTLENILANGLEVHKATHKIFKVLDDQD